MNVLIITGRCGMGHVSAANALKEEIETARGDANVTVVDIIDYLFAPISNGMYKVFDLMVGKTPRLYNTCNRLNEHFLALPLKKWFTRRFQALVDMYEPDLLISTWPVGARYIGEYKELTGNDIPYITCITDMAPHKEWLSKTTSAYIVGSEITKNGLLERGISEEKIYVAGIPVKQAFKETGNAGAAVKAGRKEVLIMGGGLGLIPGIEEVLAHFADDNGTHVTVVTGSNRKMKERLDENFSSSESIDIVGYTDAVADYMKNADCLVTKAGGITMFEAINSETPLLVIPPFFEQEKDNAEYIESRGIGVVFKGESEEWPEQIEKVLAAETKSSSMIANMRKIKAENGKNAPAQAIAALCG